MFHGWIAVAIGAVVSLIHVPPAAAQGISAGDRAKIGLTDLAALLGSAAPDGEGITAAQVEAPLTSGGTNYLPNAADSQLLGDTIIDKHGAGTTSTHATAVAQAFYGSNGVSPGVATIDAYNANLWIYSSFLRTNNWQAPQVTTRKVMNNSWVGSFAVGGNDGVALATDALRRIDYVVNRDKVVVVAGVNNGVTSFPQVLGNAYNVIAVGLSSGNSSPGPSTIDVAGRAKPDVVVPATSTSIGTAWVSGAAAILLETAGGNAAAAQPETIKAAMLAGATKDEFDLAGATPTTFDDWSRTTSQPLDYQYGAGELNVYNSYQILAAGQQSASMSSDVTPVGWDYADISAEGYNAYFFDIPEGYIARYLSAIATWNRDIEFTLGINYAPATLTPSLASVDLGLLRADGYGFEDVVDYSNSAIDNVEHVYQEWLLSGRYALAVVGDADTEVALAWYTRLVRLGDANCDGLVDAADYTLWADNYLSSDGTWAQGDFNLDGWVDGADYTVWADYFDFGNVSTATSAAVPEPATLMLAAIGLACLSLPWIRRRRG